MYAKKKKNNFTKINGSSSWATVQHNFQNPLLGGWWHNTRNNYNNGEGTMLLSLNNNTQSQHNRMVHVKLDVTLIIAQRLLRIFQADVRTFWCALNSWQHVSDSTPGYFSPPFLLKISWQHSDTGLISS